MEIKCCNTCNRKKYCSILRKSIDHVTPSEFFCCAYDRGDTSIYDHSQIKSRWWKLENGEYAKVAAFILCQDCVGEPSYIIRGKKFNQIDFNGLLYLED